MSVIEIQRPKLPEHADRIDIGVILADTCVEAILEIYESDSVDDAAKDFLTDLMHYCDANGLDFDTCLESARASYEAEINGE